MRLLLDECMSYRVTEQSRAKGYDVAALTEPGRRQLGEEEQRVHAVSECRMLVTYNIEDFCHLIADWFQTGRSPFGILFIQEPTISRHDIGGQVRALGALLDAHPADGPFCDRCE
jgi:predicted nuclease of predicted toxin-antitoxin system